MSDLSKQINIGKELEKVLISAGVNSFAELKEIGTKQAFIRIKAKSKDACLSKLCAIEGAIQGVRWHNLSKEKKQELKSFFILLDTK